MTAKRIKVCMVLEGSYPYITGGVSSWVSDLINGIPDIDFAIYSISPKANQPFRYKFPKNVVEHKDVLITDKLKSLKKPKNKKELLYKIIAFHNEMEAGRVPLMEDFFDLMPKDYFLYSDAIKSKSSWEMLKRKNLKNNPIYPFSDYFWAWKSSHDMIFTVLSTGLPNADIYHAISTGYAGLACVGATLRRKKPFVLTEHGLYHKEREIEIRRSEFVKGYQKDMWVKIFNKMSQFSYKYASLIISLFEYNRKRQVELGAPTLKTRVIPNGIDTTRYSSLKRENRKGFHMGLVGRVVPIKDIKTFIATAKIVSVHIPEAIFYCIGPTDEDPGYYKDCVLLVKSFKLTDKFIFTGSQDVREYYSFLDVLLLTSIREAQPLVILEAYCANIPVVSTTVGNVPELLDFDDRLLAASKDSEKLAKGVMFIHDNPEIVNQMKIKNKEKVLNFYNRELLYKTYSDIYTDLYNKHT